MTYITPVVFTMIVHPLKKYVYMRYMHVIYTQKLVSIVYVYILQRKRRCIQTSPALRIVQFNLPPQCKVTQKQFGRFSQLQTFGVRRNFHKHCITQQPLAAESRENRILRDGTDADSKGRSSSCRCDDFNKCRMTLQMCGLRTFLFL